MKASYRQMIDEHESIERHARQLLADIRDDGSPAKVLGSQLDALAHAVGDHIEVENEVVSSVDDAPKTGPWVETWIEGLTAFERLRSDWTAFLDRWDAEAIGQDRRTFQSDAEAILSRLSQRLQQETRAFYATALQHGALALR